MCQQLNDKIFQLTKLFSAQAPYSLHKEDNLQLEISMIEISNDDAILQTLVQKFLTTALTTDIKMIITEKYSQQFS